MASSRVMLTGTWLVRESISENDAGVRKKDRERARKLESEQTHCELIESLNLSHILPNLLRFESNFVILSYLMYHGLESLFVTWRAPKFITGIHPVFSSPDIFWDAETRDGQGFILGPSDQHPSIMPQPEEEEMKTQNGTKTPMVRVLLTLFHQHDHRGPFVPCSARCHKTPRLLKEIVLRNYSYIAPWSK